MGELTIRGGFINKLQVRHQLNRIHEQVMHLDSVMLNFQTLGRASKYDSGTSISAKAMLFMAIAAFNI